MSGYIFSHILSVFLLKSFIILSSCARDVEDNSTSSVNRRLEQQSVWWSPKGMPMRFSRQQVKSSSRPFETPCRRKRGVVGPHASHPFVSRTHHSLCPLFCVQFPSGNRCLAPQFRILQRPSTTLSDVSCPTFSQSQPLRSTFRLAFLCIFAPATCTSVDGPALDQSNETSSARVLSPVKLGVKLVLQ